MINQNPNQRRAVARRFFTTIGLLALLSAGGLWGCRFDPSGVHDNTSGGNNNGTNDNNSNGNVVSCGDSVREGTELCDGADLGGADCQSEGFDSGTLACLASCAAFDTSSCVGADPECGDGQREGAEICDGADHAGRDCTTEGFYGGTLTCLGNCSGFDTSSCSGQCGDGVINGPEECEAADLAGTTCADVGCHLGTLACSTSCTFDVAACHAGHDEDSDTVDDNCDNCPTYPNPAQGDGDNDSVGNACEGAWNMALLSDISAFESLVTQANFTVLSGSWIPGIDEVTGSAIASNGDYLHTTQVPNVNYSVEATFRMSAPQASDRNWTAIVFAWEVIGGNLYAYECAYERGPDILSIWRISGTDDWEQLTAVTMFTSVTGAQWHRLRAYREGSSVRCVYDDETGATDQATVSGLTVWNNMSGNTGLRVYNETATFTSFVLYR